MGNLKITDLVDKQAFDQLKNLETELNSVKEVYKTAAAEMVQGIKMKVEVVGDVEKMNQVIAAGAQKAQTATEGLNKVVKTQEEIINRTTNTISRELAELEKENKAKREAYKSDERAVKIAEQVLGTREANIKRLADVTTQLKKNSEQQKELNKSEKEGALTAKEVLERRAALLSQERELKIAKGELNKVINNEEKMNQAAAGSYQQLSLQLEILKKAYKELNDGEKNSETGTILGEEIANLDAHLKDLSADMGEFQRNVGNYAIGANAAESETERLNRALTTHAKTAEEAEEQNKLLFKALKQVDQTADGAKDEINQYSVKIRENNEVIEEAKGKHDALMDSMMNYFGINSELGSSFQKLNSSGGFINGVKDSVKSLWKSLLLVITNPLALAFLGLGGTIMTVKWWYEYNKGLEKSTRLTNQFTGATGDALKNYRNQVQAIAENEGKGFEEVLQSTNSLAKNFHISFDSALKLMKDGFVSGADASEQFLDNVKEYPTYFREAGLSAEQFIAITTHANKQSIFSDKALDAIKEGNLRIREMTKATKDAIDGLGLNADKLKKDMDSGLLTTFDVMKKVSEKLGEFPETSSVVGTAIADIFGGPGEDAGLEYLKTLKDIDDNMDSQKKKAGELAKIHEEQLESEIELQNAISALFDQTGGGFEKMTGKAKVFANKALVGVAKGLIGIANYFIELYNESEVFRIGWTHVVVTFKNGISLVGNLFHQLVDVFKAGGRVLKGIFKLDWNEVKAGFVDFAKSYNDLIVNQMKDARKNMEEGVAGMQKKVKPITIPVSVESDSPLLPSSGGKHGGKVSGKGTTSTKDKGKSEVAESNEALKEDLKNRLSIVKKNSEEELNIKLQKLAIEEEEEVKAAEKSGADVNLIHAKYDKQALEERQNFYNAKLEMEDKALQDETERRNAAYLIEQAVLKRELEKGLVTQEEYEEKKQRLDEQFAVDTLKKIIENYKKRLESGNITDEERLKLTIRLSKAEAELENERADAAIEANRRILESEERTKSARIEKLDSYTDKAIQSFSAIQGLMNAIYANHLQDLEKQEEDNQAAYDREVERIDKLVQKGALSSEEGESRKRAAQRKTEHENAVLEKKKAQIKYKQAMWDKANNLAQTAIATARAIMEALPDVGLAAFVGAIGAVQAATIIATPIPKYAEGTRDGGHPGGLALVGDGGKREFVLIGNEGWVTPDTPTLVDMPKGAEVFPDVRKLFVDLDNPNDNGKSTEVVVNNDFKALEKKSEVTNTLLYRLLRQNKEIAESEEFDRFRRSNGL